jgi:thiosulfate/3-mercaptopyruvate sulfurtransferase
VLIGNDEMVSRVREGRSQIIDARTPKEFSGEDIRAIRGGHIPNAVNLPYEQNWVDPLAAVKLARKEVKSREGMSLKPTESLKSLYADLDPEKEVVVYCQSGVRASVTATILKDLGFKDVKVYEPSWLGYAGRLDAPVEQEVFLNVGALNSRIGAMQTQMGEMAAELARLKAAR